MMELPKQNLNGLSIMTNTSGTIKISYDKMARIAHVSVHGPYNIKSINSRISDVKIYTDDPKFRGFIWDWRDADLTDLTISELKASWEEQASQGLNQGWRAAAVTTDNNARLILRLWEAVGEHFLPRKRKVFSSIEDARMWLLREED